MSRTASEVARSRWLARAASSVGRTSAEPRSPFALTCDCGRTLEGARAAEFQQVRCPDCGELHYVLPRDVYPPPPEPRRKKSARQADAAVNRGATAKGNAHAGTLTTRAPEPLVKRLARRSVAAADRLRGRGGKLATEGGTAVRRFATPFRLVVLAILILLMTTGWWMWRQQSLEQARMTLRDASELGARALAARDVSEAETQFARAVAALDTLGRDDAFARNVRQTGGQLTALEGLSVTPLDRTLQGFLSEAESAMPADASDALVLGPLDGWVILDMRVGRVAEPDGDLFEIEYPLMVGEWPVVLRARPPAFAGLNLETEPRRVVFAARLKEARLSAEGHPRLIVELDSERIVLWTKPELLPYSGLTVDPSVTAILDAQAKVLEVE